MTTRRMYLVHSPYRGPKFRGLEKCHADPVTGAFLLFDSYDEAEDYRVKQDTFKVLRVVPVTVTLPDVGDPL